MNTSKDNIGNEYNGGILNMNRFGQRARQSKLIWYYGYVGTRTMWAEKSWMQFPGKSGKDQRVLGREKEDMQKAGARENEMFCRSLSRIVCPRLEKPKEEHNFYVFLLITSNRQINDS